MSQIFSRDGGTKNKLHGAANFENIDELSVLPELVLDFTHIALFPHAGKSNSKGLWSTFHLPCKK